MHKFKKIEAKTFKKVCEYGCEIIKEMLEELDTELGVKRDKKKYRSKGKRKKVIKTIMGEVEFFRTVYEVTEAEIKSYVYLLDEEIELTESGFFSGILSEYIVNASCESTYRNAAKTVTELIFTFLGNIMKGRRVCWSIKGGITPFLSTVLDRLFSYQEHC